MKNSEEISDDTRTIKIGHLKATEKPATQEEVQEYTMIAICKQADGDMNVLISFQVRNPLLNYTFVSDNKKPKSK